MNEITDKRKYPNEWETPIIKTSYSAKNVYRSEISISN